MVNTLHILGRVGGDPELKYTATGTAICNFSLATNKKWRDRDGVEQQDTQWHRIEVFGKTAEFCSNYAGKGSLMYIEGEVCYEKWENKDGQMVYMTKVKAKKVDLLGGDRSGATETSEAPSIKNIRERLEENEKPFCEDDIDF